MRRQDVPVTFELAGYLASEMKSAGNSLAHSTEIPDIEHKRLLLSPQMERGQLHVYRADCHAGQRVRVQLVIPALPTRHGIAPAFGIVAQSLPYSADVERLPVEIPHGYSAVVAPAPEKLLSPLRDAVTGALYYPGPVIDTRMLVSGVCYIVVWSPRSLSGTYMLSVGHRRSWSWLNWLGVPLFWWRLRSWYGLSRVPAYVLGTATILVLWIGFRWRKRTRETVTCA